MVARGAGWLCPNELQRSELNAERNLAGQAAVDTIFGDPQLDLAQLDRGADFEEGRLLPKLPTPGPAKADSVVPDRVSDKPDGLAVAIDPRLVYESAGNPEGRNHGRNVCSPGANELLRGLDREVQVGTNGDLHRSELSELKSREPEFGEQGAVGPAGHQVEVDPLGRTVKVPQVGRLRIDLGLEHVLAQGRNDDGENDQNGDEILLGHFLVSPY